MGRKQAGEREGRMTKLVKKQTGGEAGLKLGEGGVETGDIDGSKMGTEVKWTGNRQGRGKRE